jgi:hypothetical protein
MSISNIVNNFSRNLGNGQKMGEALLDAINHAIKTGDTSIISVLFDKVNVKKDSNALSGLTATVRAVYIGANITTDKKTNRTIVKTKNATLSNSAVEVLNQLVVDNVSMRGNKWASAFNTDAEVKEFDPIKYAQGIAKRNPERIGAMIAALQVVQKELDNKKVLEKVAA